MSRMTTIRLTLLAALLALPQEAWAWGEERFGNDPLRDEYSTELAPLVNHKSRVYYSWVNGHERFLYKGDVDQLNHVLRLFAGLPQDRHEVVLFPEQGEIGSFNNEKRIEYDWQLEIVGGVCSHLPKEHLGDQVWSPVPIFYIHLGDGIQLAALDIPDGVTLLSTVDASRRCREALKSDSKTVRGWGCGVLASFDDTSPENMQAIARQLKDPDDWVRLNAAGVLAKFGKLAEPALPSLRECAASADEQLAKRASESIAAIQQATAPASEAMQSRQHVQNEIARFVAKRNGNAEGRR